MSLDEIVRRVRTSGFSVEETLREIFQKLILYSIVECGLGKYYVFQGGTALRIVYGSPRISLDMDFTCIDRSIDLLSEDMARFLGILTRLLGPDGISVSRAREKIFRSEGFYRCFFVFNTIKFLGRKLRMKIEALIRKYKTEFRREVVEIEYPVRSAVGILVKSPGQILADKVASLAGGFRRGNIRWRDVFDIYWLKERFNGEIDRDYFKQKFGSWMERPEDLVSLLKKNFSLMKKSPKLR